MLSSTENPPLKFNPSIGETKQNAIVPGNKIGWLHSMADAPGATFDIVIRDTLGREKFRRNNCATDTKEFGELVNLPTLIGEPVEVEIDNLKGATEIQVFLN